jgi:hypothetical protein
MSIPFKYIFWQLAPIVLAVTYIFLRPNLNRAANAAKVPLLIRKMRSIFMGAKNVATKNAVGLSPFVRFFVARAAVRAASCPYG